MELISGGVIAAHLLSQLLQILMRRLLVLHQIVLVNNAAVDNQAEQAVADDQAAEDEDMGCFEKICVVAAVLEISQAQPKVRRTNFFHQVMMRANMILVKYPVGMDVLVRDGLLRDVVM